MDTTTIEPLDHDLGDVVNERHCKWCGQFLVNSDARQKFCSAAHRSKAWNAAQGKTNLRSYDRLCPICQTDFVAHHPSALYNTAACRQKAKRLTATGDFDPSAYRKDMGYDHE